MAVVPAYSPFSTRAVPMSSRSKASSTRCARRSRISAASRHPLRAASVFPVRQRMVPGRLAALFLIRRVGLSPSGALLILALYWAFLTPPPGCRGHPAARAPWPPAAGSGVSALFGCLILFLTKTGFGAASGVLFLGAGYAVSIRWWRSHRPPVSLLPSRFLNGIFSLALVGLLAPPRWIRRRRVGRGRGGGLPLLGLAW